jgi:hypothetical protein
MSMASRGYLMGEYRWTAVHCDSYRKRAWRRWLKRSLHRAERRAARLMVNG